MSKINIIISASSFDTFEVCQAKFFYNVMKKKVLPLHEKNRNLDRGSLIHSGLETYYNALSAGVDFNDRAQAMLMKVREIASDVTQSNVDLDSELPIILKALEENVTFWHHEDEQLEILAIETPFDHILYEDDDYRIVLSGKIDLLVNQHGAGSRADYQNLPYDHKSHERESETLRLSNQFFSYCEVTKSNFLIVNKVGLQRTLKPHERFKRIPLSYDPEIIQEWKDNVIRTILEDYTTCVATGHWKMNFTSCNKFNRQCEYYIVCNSSGSEAKWWKLESMFVDAEKHDKYADKQI